MKYLRILMLISLLATSIPGLHPLLTPAVQAQGMDWSFISTDVDGDGLPNSVEDSGWCNGVGCFSTDPFDPDSDNDGLTDGEEKLFDSHPKDDASPGIYVVYEDALKTKEYYPWQPYGHKMIARGDTFDPPRPDEVDQDKGLGVDLDAVVVRRGSTFHVGGPIEATLQINKSDPSLSDLSAVQDPLSGLWVVTVPANGTTGKYTLTLNGESLDLFVIFELISPSGELTQLGIEKFLYDDDPEANYDEAALMMSGQTQYREGPQGDDYRLPKPVTDWWWSDNPHTYPPYAIPNGEFMAEGGTYKFDTQQYSRFIMEEYAGPAINGLTDRKAAAQALTEKVDASTAFRNPRVLYDSWKTLKAIDDQSDRSNQCSNISGAVTALTRAAGLPSRVLFTDWTTSTFDHANEVWINGEWRVYRGYIEVELKSNNTTEKYNGLCENNHNRWPACGANINSSRPDWGKDHYDPAHSGVGGAGNIIATVNENWTQSSVRAYRWPSWVKDGKKEGVSMVKKEYFETVHVPYWGQFGWTQEPLVSKIFNSKYNDWPEAPPSPESISGLTVTNDGPTELGQETAFLASLSSGSSLLYKWDFGDGAKTGFTEVSDPKHTYSATGKFTVMVEATNGVSSDTANTTVTVTDTLPGPGGGAGLLALSAGSGQLSASTGQVDNSLDYQSPEVQLGDVVAEYGLDLNGNGQYDQFVLEVEVSAAQPGDYWIRGQLSTVTPNPLLDDVGGAIADAYDQVTLAAGLQRITLIFDGPDISLKRADGPYILDGVWILDGSVENPGPDKFVNQSLAFRHRSYTTAAYQATDFETYGALLSNSYSHAVLDSDGNGKPDALVINTGLQIFQPGAYAVAGTLYDANDDFVDRATWNGSGADVTLQFNDLAGTVGPYTLRNLELLDDTGQIIDQLTNAYTIETIPDLTTSAIASFDVYGGGAALSAFSATPTNNFSESLVDGNLKVDVEVNVSAFGTYQAEAWLADAEGNLVTWAAGPSTQLDEGVHTLSITFDGENIQAHGAGGPYKVVALKVLDGSVAYEVLDTVDVALTTQAYSLDQLAASPANILLADFVENGPALWSAEVPWAIEHDLHQYMAASDAWSASNADASLRLASPLNLSALTDVTLKFLTSYQFGAGENGYVEVSTDGNTWNPIATFSGQRTWSDNPQVIDLGSYIGQLSVDIRFRLASSGGDPDAGWAIDDIVIVGYFDSQTDTDSDGIPDYQDSDIDGDGIPNVTEGSADTDGDGIPDYKDTDSDNDGIPDGTEGNTDSDDDGAPDYQDTDSDNDGIDDSDEWSDSGNHDSCLNDGGLDTDGDGIANCKDNDIDGDGIPNYADTDSDGDGIDDKDEVGDPNNPADTDGDGIPDYLDSDPAVNQGIILQKVYLPFVTK